ncbi:AAA-ATPase-like domain-containing protein, partial [Dissophora ornata]
ISKLGSFKEDVLIFLRPRRFGKSLFLSTLAHFHGVQYKGDYKALFQGLDVDHDVERGKVTPGQYLVLALDFSKIDRSADLIIASDGLNDMINNAIKNFYKTYAPYLGEKASDDLIDRNISPRAVGSLDACVNLVREALNAVTEKDDPLYGVKGIYLLADEYDAFSNEFLDPDDPRPWEQLRTGPNSLLKGFWATVKAMLGPRAIAKCFITGVSPLSMADHTSGFNVATYVTWREELSGLCGLTAEDVLSALRLPIVCKSEDEVRNHFKIMKDNYDGYNFVEMDNAPHVFNTNTCLEYLERQADRSKSRKQLGSI